MSTFFQTSLAIPASSADTPASPLCPGDLPLLLLPVRLETRFFTLADSTTELRVRVFPDKIHCDSHEPDLTPDELTWGQHYWQHDWRAGPRSARPARTRATTRTRVRMRGGSSPTASGRGAPRGSCEC